MSTIRHICAGHEYRFDTITGQVRNNYGTVRSVLMFHMFTPTTCPYIASLYPANEDGTANTRSAGSAGVAVIRSATLIGDDALAEFAIGQTAAHFPER